MFLRACSLLFVSEQSYFYNPFPDSQRYEEVERDGDEDRGEEADEKEEEEVVAQELLLHHTPLLDVVEMIKGLLSIISE